MTYFQKRKMKPNILIIGSGVYCPHFALSGNSFFLALCCISSYVLLHILLTNVLEQSSTKTRNRTARVWFYSSYVQSYICFSKQRLGLNDFPRRVRRFTGFICSNTFSFARAVLMAYKVAAKHIKSLTFLL